MTGTLKLFMATKKSAGSPACSQKRACYRSRRDRIPDRMLMEWSLAAGERTLWMQSDIRYGDVHLGCGSSWLGTSTSAARERACWPKREQGPVGPCRQHARSGEHIAGRHDNQATRLKGCCRLLSGTRVPIYIWILFKIKKPSSDTMSSEWLSCLQHGTAVTLKLLVMQHLVLHMGSVSARIGCMASSAQSARTYTLPSILPRRPSLLSAVCDRWGWLHVILHACPSNHMQRDCMTVALPGSSKAAPGHAPDRQGPETAVQPGSSCAEKEHTASGGNKRQWVLWREPSRRRQDGPDAEYHLHATAAPLL